MQGTLDDWPAEIQDGVFAALERLSAREKLPLKVVYSKCDVDHDVPEGVAGRYYIHVVASEIVMADERTMDPKRVIAELPDEIRRLLH